MLVSLDCDEVLFDFIGGYVAWRAAQGLSSFDPVTQVSYDLSGVLGITPEENLEAIAAFVNDPAALDLPPVPGCVAAVEALTDLGCDLVVVTARRQNMLDGTQAWLARHLPMVSGLHVVGDTLPALQPGAVVADAPGRFRSPKVDCCVRLGAAIHVDDNPYHLTGFAGTSVVPVLFGSYPWTTREAFDHCGDFEALVAYVSRVVLHEPGSPRPGHGSVALGRVG